jgi:hypothetical protein
LIFHPGFFSLGEFPPRDLTLRAIEKVRCRDLLIFAVDWDAVFAISVKA